MPQMLENYKFNKYGLFARLKYMCHLEVGFHAKVCEWRQEGKIAVQHVTEFITERPYAGPALHPKRLILDTDPIQIHSSTFIAQQDMT